MSLKIKSSGINFNVSTINDFPTDGLEDGLVCVVTDKDRGGTFVYRSADSAVNNGGTIFNGWTRQYNGAVNVKWFGAKGDGIADDTTSITNAMVSNNISSSNSFGGYSGIYVGNSIPIYFPKGKYVISSTLPLSDYMVLIGDDAIIMPSASFISTNWGLTGSFWMGKIKGIQIINFTNGMYINTGNVDTDVVDIKECSFINNGTALKYNSTSSQCITDSCKFHNNKTTLYIESCDNFVLSNSWLSEGLVQSNYSGSIINYGALKIINLLFVPKAQSSSNTSVVANYGSINITLSRFGAESGSRTIINNFKEGSDNNLWEVSITNSSVYTATGDPIVLYKFPNNIIFKDNRGLTDDAAALSFNSYLTTVDAELARIGTTISFAIDIDFQLAKGIEVLLYRKVAPFILIDNETVSYGYSSGIVTNTVYDDVKFFGNKNNVDYYFFRRHTVYQIDINLDAETGGTFARYLVKSNYAGTGIADLIPIYEGATTSAPRLFNSSGYLKIKTNGIVAAQNYTYRVSRVDSGYYAV